MDHGRILALDTPDELKRLIPGGTMLELRVCASEAIAAGHTSEHGPVDEHFQVQGGDEWAFLVRGRGCGV